MTPDMSPLVSVIIPTYDFARFLPETIESVRDQTYTNVEMLVIDDGSTDETPDVLGELEGPDLKWRRTPNRGVSAARNLALSLSEGEYVAFLDADDRWLQEKLDRQIAVLESEPDVGFVFSDFARFDRHGRFDPTQFELIPGIEALPTRPAASDDGLVLEGDPFVEFLSLELTPIYPSTLVVRGDLARSLEFPEDIGLSQDLHYFLQLYECSRPAFVPEPLVEIRRHENNLSGANVEKRLADIEVLRKYARESVQEDHRTFLRRQLARRFAGLGHEHFWKGRLLDSARAYLECLRYPGRRLNAAGHLAALPLAPLLGPLLNRS